MSCSVNAASDTIKLVDAVSVVNAPVLGVVDPIAGATARLNVPPSVKLPDDVTVPVKVKPLTVPVPATEVTVPVVGVAQAGIPAVTVNT